MMCVTKIVVDVAKEHRDLERFGSPKCNNLHPLFVYRCVYALAGMSYISFTKKLPMPFYI
jgi:hypothetical protein